MSQPCAAQPCPYNADGDQVSPFCGPHSILVGYPVKDPAQQLEQIGMQIQIFARGYLLMPRKGASGLVMLENKRP